MADRHETPETGGQLGLPQVGLRAARRGAPAASILYSEEKVGSGQGHCDAPYPLGVQGAQRLRGTPVRKTW